MIRRTVAAAALVVQAPSPILAGPPRAQDRVAIDLPAGTLAHAVDQLGRQTGVSVTIGDPSLARRRVAAIRGRLDVGAAIVRLATMAGAAPRRISRLAWRLDRPAAAARGAREGRARSITPPPPATAAEDLIVIASKRGTAARSLAQAVDVVSLAPGAVEVGSDALVRATTLLSSTYRGPGRDKLFLRGIADSSFAGQLQSPTGQYLGDVRLTYAGTDPDLQLYDVRSVEILPGPQGTLYGAGTLGGVVRINPNPPERGVATGAIGGGVSAVAQGDVGRDVDAMVNVPVGDRLALRAVGYSRDDAGYIDRLADGRDDANRTRIDGARATVRWFPAGSVAVDVAGVAQRIRSDDAFYVTDGTAPPTSASPFREPAGSDYLGGQIVASGPIGDLAFVSATGVSRQRSFDRTVFGDTPVVRLDRREDLVTQEVRVNRRGPDGRGWLLGWTYVGSEGRLALVTPIVPLDLRTRATEVAVFGEAGVWATRQLLIGGGARLARSDATFRQRAEPGGTAIASDPLRRRDWWLLPSLSVTYRPLPALSLFARYRVARRARIPVTRTGTIAEPLPAGRGSEATRSIEGGLRWDDGDRLHVQATFDATRWTSLQIERVEGLNGISSRTVAAATVSTAYLSVDWRPAPGLDVRASAARTFAPAQATRAATGASDDVAPLMARVGARWSRRVGRTLTLVLDGAARYDGERPAPSPLAAPPRLGGFASGQLVAALRRDDNEVTLAIDNVTDSRAVRFLAGSNVLPIGASTTLRPRTIRIGVRRHW
ncbi:TonB-dependent receptor [Sphingomonas sp. A2-49]|uniref:TonB-dependent receptor n=1 Tax=Sphingomonas sp. A2-49 TaxID=1391375 RepID=UPI0021CF4681|nr:TonB-dependent receptor [Sphingomonas sp. A2-49]MCU6453894.1 TonB-dependent receptor [Sphingomonas sp. A2-49]